MYYSSTQIWHPGKRSRNEDSLCIEQVRTGRGSILLAAVCDGIGGLEKGEVASGYVTEELVKWFYEDGLRLARYGSKKRLAFCMAKRLEQISSSLFLHGESRQIHMGTTVSAMLLWGGNFLLLHVGDSRVYRLRYGCRQLTEDQSDRQGRLMQAVGTAKECRPQILLGHVRSGDRFLLCSDGFYRRQSEKELAKLFGRKLRHPKQAAELERVLQEVTASLCRKGESDNISAVFVSCEKVRKGRGGRVDAET